MAQTFILVDPNDDSGNDDGILDRCEMTKEEANQINQRNREERIDLRWIPLKEDGPKNHLRWDNLD